MKPSTSKAMNRALQMLRDSDYSLALDRCGRFVGDRQTKLRVVGERGFVRRQTIDALFGAGMIKLHRPRDFVYVATPHGKRRATAVARTMRESGRAVCVPPLRWGVIYQGYCIIACASRKRANQLAELGRRDTPGDGVRLSVCVVDLFTVKTVSGGKR